MPDPAPAYLRIGDTPQSDVVVKRNEGDDFPDYSIPLLYPSDTTFPSDHTFPGDVGA